MSFSEFLDSSKYLTRVAVASPKVVLGDPLANAEELVRVVEELADKGVKVVVFPELFLTGHGLGHFFYDEVIIQDVKDALRFILKKLERLNIFVIFGLPFQAYGQNFNVLAAVCRGKLLGLLPKVYLTSTGEYDEHKFFARGVNIPFNTIPYDGAEVPFDPYLLFEFVDEDNLIVFPTNCENEWGTHSPGGLAMLHGATVIAHANASSGLVGKKKFKQKMLDVFSGLGFATWLYAAMGPSDSGNTFIYSGYSFISDRGVKIAETSDDYAFDTQYAIADADLAACMQDKTRTTSFAERAGDFAGDFKRIPVFDKLGSIEPLVYEQVYRQISAHPFAPDDPASIREMCEEIRAIISTAIARRLMHIGQNKVILGLSGGWDSFVTMDIALDAMKRIGVGPENIICVTMPYQGSTSPQTRGNVDTIAAAFGVTLIERDITDLVDHDIDVLTQGQGVKAITKQNVKARIRKQLLLDLSQEYDALELGTGDLSEYLVGWMTYLADQASQFATLMDVFKTTLKLLMWFSRVVLYKDDPAKQQAILDVEGTPVSPELDDLGANGQIVEETDEKIGPAELRDVFSWYFLRFGSNPIKIAWYSFIAFHRTYSLATIKKWLGVFLFREIQLSQYKRQLRADGPKVGSISADSHNDRVQPSDMRWTPWQRWWEQIPDID